jgi:trimeric autotransporter adhesin
MYIQKQDDSPYLCVDSDSIKNLKRNQNKNQAEFDDVVDTNNVLKLKKINEEESFLANEQNISSNSSENTNSTTEIILNAQYNNKSSMQYPLSTFIQQPTSQSSSSSSSTSSFNKFSNDTSLNSIKSSILASQNRENDPNLLCSPSSSLLLLSSSPLLILNQTTTLTTTNVTTTGSSASSSSTSNTIDDADLDCRNDADGDNGDKVSFKSSSISSSISNRQSLHLQNENDKFKKTQITNLYPLIDEQTHPSYQNKKNKDLNVNTYLEKFERIYNNFESTIDENDSKLTSRKPNFIQDNHYSTSSMYTSASSSSSNFNRKNNSSNQIQTFSYV